MSVEFKGCGGSWSRLFKLPSLFRKIALWMLADSKASGGIMGHYGGIMEEAPYITACCTWSVISSCSNLNRCSMPRRGGGLGSRPKKMYGERWGDGVKYHLMSPTPRR